MRQNNFAIVMTLSFDPKLPRTTPANFHLRQDHCTSLWISDFNEFRDPCAPLVPEEAIFQENRAVGRLIQPEFVIGARS
jgi:hypothetical protein